MKLLDILWRVFAALGLPVTVAQRRGGHDKPVPRRKARFGAIVRFPH